MCEKIKPPLEGEGQKTQSPIARKPYKSRTVCLGERKEEAIGKIYPLNLEDLAPLEKEFIRLWTIFSAEYVF